MDFAAEDEVGGVRGDGVKGVIGVDVTPVVEGGAVILERGSGARKGVGPGAVAAVEILVVLSAWTLSESGRSSWRMRGVRKAYPVSVVASQHFVAFCDSLRDRFVALPRLHHHIFPQREVPLQEHLLPYYWRHPRRSHVIVVVIHKPLKQRP